MSETPEEEPIPCEGCAEPSVGVTDDDVHLCGACMGDLELDQARAEIARMEGIIAAVPAVGHDDDTYPCGHARQSDVESRTCRQCEEAWINDVRAEQRRIRAEREETR